MTRIAVLGLDPAGVSGWALCTPREIVASGACESALERRDVIVAAKVQVQARGLELVVVYEAHHPSTGHTPSVIAGLALSQGRWFEQVDLAGIARSHTVGVSPQTWRHWAYQGARVADPDRWAIERCRELGIAVSCAPQACACLIAWWGAHQSAEVMRIAQRARAA